MIFIEIKNHRGASVSFMEQFSDLGAGGEETASSGRCAAVSVFGIRGQGVRIGNLFTSFSSLSTL